MDSMQKDLRHPKTRQERYDIPPHIVRYLVIFFLGFATASLVLLLVWLTGFIPFSSEVEKARCDYITPPETQETYADDYFRNHALDASEQVLYDEMETALRTMADGIIPDRQTTIRQATNIYRAVLSDNPDIFWVQSDFERLENPSGVYFIKFNYTCTPEEAATKAEEHKEKAQKILDEISLYRGSDEKQEWTAQLIHDWLAANVSYKETDHDQTIEGSFDDGEAVCAGYAAAMKYLCDYAGIPCLHVRGHIYGDFGKPHAWNMLVADGKLFYVDPTWDDVEHEKSSTAQYLWFSEDVNDFKKSHWTGYTYGNGELDDFASHANSNMV